MKRKYRLRNKAKHPFTKLTGYPVFILSGGSSCQVVKSKTVNSQPLVQKPTPVRLVAAYLYARNPSTLISFGYDPFFPEVNEYQIDPSSIKKVEQTCRVHQCVNPLHLKITLHETKSW